MKIEIYHRVGASLLGIGVASPDKAVEIEKKVAEALIKDNPVDWSLTPFISSPSPSSKKKEPK